MTRVRTYTRRERELAAAVAAEAQRGDTLSATVSHLAAVRAQLVAEVAAVQEQNATLLGVLLEQVNALEEARAAAAQPPRHYRAAADAEARCQRYRVSDATRMELWTAAPVDVTCVACSNGLRLDADVNARAVGATLDRERVAFAVQLAELRAAREETSDATLLDLLRLLEPHRGPNSTPQECLQRLLAERVAARDNYAMLKAAEHNTDAARAHVSQLEAALKRSEALCNQHDQPWKGWLADAYAERDAARSDHRRVAAQRDEAYTMRDAEQAQLDALKEELSDVRTSCGVAENEYTKACAERDAVRDEFNRACVKLAGLREECERLLAERDAARPDPEGQREDIRAVLAAVKLAATEGQVDALEEQNAALLGENAELTADVRAVQAESAARLKLWQEAVAAARVPGAVIDAAFDPPAVCATFKLRLAVTLERCGDEPATTAVEPTP